ncbi:hypothetical protein AB1Y20_006024 [Prymnesium parvum]|uniref:Uncharacterized protein n=1 Tax=Prymnesium parvum TaxID=97485 RepID=A0AB34J3F3_PRYPA
MLPPRGVLLRAFSPCASPLMISDPHGAGRALAVTGGSTAFAAVVTLPPQPEFWDAGEAMLAAAPLCTLAAMFSLVFAAWSVFGSELHPITAKARGIEPPPAHAFGVLGLSGALLGTAAIAFGWYPLPVAVTPVELAHCVVPFALWCVDVRLLRWLNPHVDWPEEALSLPANYGEEHSSLVGAALAFIGVLWFEVYVQQLVASPLTESGWPLIGSAALIALNAGFVNHALANGLQNGILCTEFYWTVSLMFGLSNSVLPVGIYHHLMYSMPTFVRSYDEAVQSAPRSDLHAVRLHVALAAWHLAVFSALSLVVPRAMELQPASASLSFSFSPSAMFGLFGVGLIGTAVVGAIPTWIEDAKIKTE